MLPGFSALIIAAALTLSPLAAAAQKSPFTDTLPEWAQDSIVNLNKLGIIKGYGDGRFGPADTLTRGQMLTLIYRTLRHKNIIKPPALSDCNIFSDVKRGDYMYLPMCAFAHRLVEVGAMEELPSEGEGGANELISRGEVAAVLAIYLGDTLIDAMGTEPESTQLFSDIPTSDEKFAFTALIHKTGLMTGKPDGTFDPDKPINRAEAAIVLNRTLNKLEMLGIRRLVKKLREDETDTRSYMEQCADHIQQKATECSKYANWSLDIAVTRTNIDKEKVDVLEQGIIVGPDNECLGTRKGKTYPVTVDYVALDAQISSTRRGDTQILCHVQCTGWECPEGEAELEQTSTCIRGTMPTTECMKTCRGSCYNDPSQFDCAVCGPTECPDGSVPSLICARNCSGYQTCVRTNSSCSSCVYLQPEPAPPPPPPPPTVPPTPPTPPPPSSGCDANLFHQCVEENKCTQQFCESNCSGLDPECMDFCMQTIGQCVDVCLQLTNCTESSVPSSPPPPPPPPPPSPSCTEPAWRDCRAECAGLPSYPTYAFEDCLTVCADEYQQAMTEFNNCQMGQ